MYRHTVLAALCVTTGYASAGELDPLQGGSIDLGGFQGVVYYTEADNSFRVVTTIAEGEAGLPVRFEATLDEGQSLTDLGSRQVGRAQPNRRDFAGRRQTLRGRSRAPSRTRSCRPLNLSPPRTNSISAKEQDNALYARHSGLPDIRSGGLRVARVDRRRFGHPSRGCFYTGATTCRPVGPKRIPPFSYNVGDCYLVVGHECCTRLQFRAGTGHDRTADSAVGRRSGLPTLRECRQMARPAGSDT